MGGANGSFVNAQINATIQPINVQPVSRFNANIAPECRLFLPMMLGRKYTNKPIKNRRTSIKVTLTPARFETTASVVDQQERQDARIDLYHRSASDALYAILGKRMNGLLIVNKPAGVTSHDIVARLRKLTGESSIGHLGTLDPMATGVLPILMGRFTRLAQFFKQDRKRYTGTIRFGVATDTYDAEGDPVGDVVQPKLALADIRKLAEKFTGVIDQMPPPFSAKKLSGVPAHKLARAGKPVELRPARIEVHIFTILAYQAPDAKFEIEVSAGGYIRSLAHDLGAQANCGAHLASLCRVQAGEFSLDRAISLEQIADWMSEGSLLNQIPHPRLLLAHMPAVTVDDGTAIHLRNGMACNVPDYSDAPLAKIFTDQHHLFAIGRRLAGTLFQPMVVLG